MADAFAMNIDGVRSLVGSKTNKTAGYVTNDKEGVQGEKIDEFELKMTDEELLLLAKKQEILYAPYEAKISLRQKQMMKYYLGKQKEGTVYATEEGMSIAGNFLFEAVETFIPAALSRNPEPVVWSDNTELGNNISDAVKTMLQYHTDVLALRAKLSEMTRKWCVDFLGVIKHGWDAEIGDIKSEVRDVKNFIFDPTGYVNCYGEFIGYLGERITVSAERLIEMFDSSTEYITVMVDGKMGTQVTYTEWWSSDAKYVFYTFKSRVLDKHKNPHYNYDRKEGEEQQDVPGKNHFACPKAPFTFLSVFSFGDQPHDVTGLLEQNIPNQRLISRRVEQIDYNISRANNSIDLSANNFNQETAKQYAVAKIKGHPALIPAGGPIEAAVVDRNAPSLPAAFFTDLENNIENLRSIFGTAGITPSNQDNDETARGMILKQQYDNSRIGGGVGDAIEAVAKNIFNWWVQLYYVYYDEPHFAAIMGQMQATQYIEFSSQMLTARLIVSVAPDSMKPHDEIADMNQAMTLMEGGLLDPQTFFTRIKFPNPKETTGMFMLYKLNPQAYFTMVSPDIAQQVGMMPQTGGQPQQLNTNGAAPPVSGTAPPMGGVPANSSLSQVELPK